MKLLCFLFLLENVLAQSGTAIPLSENDIVGIIEILNEIRRGVEPPASNMRALVSTGWP